MADLTYIERANIENYLGMKSGYVMDFSDRTFQDFVGETVGLDIDNEKYHYASNSKANRLRQFIKVEDDQTVGKLIQEISNHYFDVIVEQQKKTWHPKDDDNLNTLFDKNTIDAKGIINIINEKPYIQKYDNSNINDSNQTTEYNFLL
jgi:hypothetical protein